LQLTAFQTVNEFMNKNSSGAGGVISTPTGGGALHSIGDKFSPDLHTGTGNYKIPITLPSGHGGHQPQIELVHSTGNGSGAFGLGFNLSAFGVIRETSKRVPRYDLDDRFVLSGAETLVPVPGAPSGATRYRPRTEGLFARIDHHHDAANKHDYWEVRSKDGLVSCYGTPGTAADDPAVVADPEDRTKVFAWKLTQTLDTFGNRIEYEYERDSGQDGPHHWDQLYLKRIRYVDYEDAGQTKFLVSVSFEYEDRPDPFSEYRAGFEIRTRKRCTRIEIRTNADQERLVRTYHLVYLDQRKGLENLLPLNGVSLLSQIKVVGHDGDETEELPPLEFGYTRFEPERRDFFPLEGADLPSRSLANPDMELVDLFGRGLPDFLEMNGSVRYWRNLGGGRFDLPREMKNAPAGLRLSDPGVQLIDANGDSRIDLLVTTATTSGYYPLKFDGLWDRRSFQKYRYAASFSLKDPEVRLIDLDGDGVIDAIRSGTRFECFFNHSENGWHETRCVERNALGNFSNINFSDDRVRWGDMTGDGMQDMVLVYDGNIEYCPNRSRGNWGEPVSMRNSPRFPYGYDPKRVLVGDVDGDGLADVIYVDHRKVLLWINQTGNRWSDPVEILGTPPISDMDAVRLVDLLGNGVSGVLWSSDRNGSLRSNAFFLDFTGGLKPYLLNEIDNHIGAKTVVEYISSIRFLQEDQKRPETRWKTSLPFPLHVVARVEMIDRIAGSKLTSEYRYSQGGWDGAEREFRGFGKVIRRDTEISGDFNVPGLHSKDEPFQTVPARAFSPPMETCTWFVQGPTGDALSEWQEADFSNEFWAGDPPALSRPTSTTDLLKSLPRHARRDALRVLRGSILRTELYAIDGTERQDRPYTVTETVFGLREEAPPGPDEPDRPHIFFPHSVGQRTTQWERGDDPMTRFSFTTDYDEHGLPVSEVSVAVPRGRNFRVGGAPGEPYLATHTLNTYAKRDDETHYVVDRMARTTTFEIKNDGRASVFTLAQRIQEQAVDGVIVHARPVIGQTLNFFDGLAFQGLPFGELGEHGALVRTETLRLTEEILHAAYKSGDTILEPPETPPYLLATGSPMWTAEYPQEFRDRLPSLGGYLFQLGGADSAHVRGYFVVAEQRRYDFQENPAGEGRGLLKATRDPLGRETNIAYDDFDLLPTEVIDPANLSTKAKYNYRVFQPREVTDPNGNTTVFSFTRLGLLESTFVSGKNAEGDQKRPSVRLVYDLFAFVERKQPISVRTVRHIHHDSETDVPQPQRDQTIETVEYSDGFGRLIQTRTQTEDVIFGNPLFGGDILPATQSDPATKQDVVGQKNADPENSNVVVSGWQIYDNKGRVVEKYEPFFSKDWDYAQPQDMELGQKVMMFYDPRGQVIRTSNPDGSEQGVIYGVPVDLDDPEEFSPTPWEAYIYDANDNAGRTHHDESQDYRHHWNTPASAVIDALGRTVETIERDRAKPASPIDPLPPIEEYRTLSTYDLRGNLLTVTDALGRVAFRHVYDLGNNPLRVENIDAGIRRTVIDAAGSVIEGRDSKGALALHAYDRLNRPIRLWARDVVDSPVTLRERLEYGDGSDPDQSEIERNANRAVNRLGKLYRHYDEAGRLTFDIYDFKGNLLEKARQVVSDAAILAVFDPPPPNWQVQAFRVDWQPPDASGQLDPTSYTTTFGYDALNRVKTMVYPQDVDGERRELRPRYNRAGALERVELNGTTFVEHIAYSAKGQRSLISYGNGVMTRHAYDPQTFRLARMRTERYAKVGEFAYHPAGAPLQELAYEYDLGGNIRLIRDRTPESGVPNSLLGIHALDRLFSYDPLYRLLLATGREQATPPPDPPWVDIVKSQDPTLTRAYAEQYQYDPVGNIMQLHHQANGASFTREFGLAPKANRLSSVTIGATDFNYTYDANGNLIRETTSRHFEWDHSDRMRIYRTQAGNAEPSVHAHYLYDSTGQRVKKLVRNQGGTNVEVTVYVDGIFEHHRLVRSGAAQENNTLHVVDNQSRIAMVRIGAPLPSDTTPAVKFHLGDHLGSSNVVIDSSGGFINREEYTPYGETSFGSFAYKRFRCTGKERDEESGLYYHGARYYASWLGRWASCDPAGIVDGLNLVQYARNNPIRFSDASGTQSDEDESEPPGWQTSVFYQGTRSVDPSNNAVTLGPTTIEASRIGPAPGEAWMEAREPLPSETGGALQEDTGAPDEEQEAIRRADNAIRAQVKLHPSEHIHKDRSDYIPVIVEIGLDIAMLFIPPGRVARAVAEVTTTSKALEAGEAAVAKAAARGPALAGDPAATKVAATMYKGHRRSEISVGFAHGYATQTDAEVIAKLAGDIQARGRNVAIGTGGHGEYPLSNFITDPTLTHERFLLEDLDLGWDTSVEVLHLTQPADYARFKALEDVARTGGGSTETIRAWCHSAYNYLY
jgi:RHS repeat-associated protein